ncbi:transposase [Liquorilactobacillus vini]|uniref:transposase n=1 Tax=Liquorilactobacillus vini TaxID=238015 RepID=UPI0003170386|nr:transposase [Liquorilactobacillus vini]
MAKCYHEEFKQNIIDLYQHKIKSAPELAKGYDVDYSNILKWLSGSRKSPVNGLTADEIQEIVNKLNFRPKKMFGLAHII